MDVITEPNPDDLQSDADILNIPVAERKGQGNKYHQTANDPKSILLFGKKKYQKWRLSLSYHKIICWLVPKIMKNYLY